MKIKRKKGFFSISAVAKMFSVHQQTVRLYEKEGLITPKRSDGNTRLFSEEDVDRLEEIVYLTHQLGINLAGVEMILKLKRQISKMQREMNKIFDTTQKELDHEAYASKQLIADGTKQLMKLKNKHKHLDEDIVHKTKDHHEPSTKDSPPQEPVWHVEYDE